MTWKRCGGCTRAIAVTAFSCEYCGQLCEDVMDFLPKDEKRPAASPVDPFEPATDDDAPGDAPETAGIPFEWEAFPGASAPDAPPPSPLAEAGPSSYDEPLASLRSASSGSPGDFSAEASEQAQASEPEDGVRDRGLDFLAEEPAANGHEEPVQPDAAAPAAPMAGVQPDQPKGPQKGMGTRQLAMVGGGVLAAGALIFTILGMRGAASPDPVAAPAPARRAPARAAAKPAAAAKATAAPAVETVRVDPDAPRWNRVTDGRWVSARGQAAAFEVSATSRVHVWMRDVTPVLVVRCERGNAEAFVYTQSAARMEPQDGDHTVQVSFDGATPVTHRWPDSAEHDALFARDAREFTRQLTQARTLQFGFTPHNAQPVLATFVLDGLEPLLASSAKQCGWHRK